MTDTIINDFNVIINNIVSDMNNPIITVGNLPILIPLIMSKVEVLKNLNGDQKRDIVLNVINKLIDQLSISNDEKIALKSIATLISPTLINTLVDSAKGVYNFGKKEIEAHCKCC